MREEFILKITQDMQVRFKALLKVYSLTKELEASFKTDENTLIREVLLKRAFEIENCKNCDEEIARFVDSEKDVNKKDFLLFLKGDESKSLYMKNKDLKELVKIIKDSKLLAQNIIQKDEELNRHIAGNKSFYQK